MTTTDAALKRFDEKVNEVRRDIPGESGETPIRDFGYKVLHHGEYFTVTDFGNIRRFLRSELERARKEESERLLSEWERVKPKEKEDKSHSDGKYYYTDYEARGYANALSDADTAIKEILLTSLTEGKV